MLSKISKFVIGLIFVPIVIGVSVAFVRSLTNIGVIIFPSSKIFLYGVFAYVIMHLFLFKPEYVYTFGHEIMHVLATWICGGGVKSFNVSKESGSVETTKSNIFINLSPYFIPTYTLILSFLYFVLPLFFRIPNLKIMFFFLAGFSLSLHLIFTAEVLKVKQPDLIKTGYLFSFVLIYIVNIILVAFILSLLFDGMTFEGFINSAYLRSKAIYVRIFTQLF